MLKKIIDNKRKELRKRKNETSLSELMKKPLYKAERSSFYKALSKTGPSFISEFKRKSPSKGFIHQNARIEDIVEGYETGGASAISVLTDVFFDGYPEDLEKAFSLVDIPLLRKDFIIDSFQIAESKSVGASAILLIAAVLTKAEVRELSSYAHDLGMDVLFEIHSVEELDKVSDDIRIIGVNNRNLQSFEVNIDTSLNALGSIPSDMIKVSESGISSAGMINRLYAAGFDAFLIGENFMKEKDPSFAAKKFIDEVNSKII